MYHCLGEREAFPIPPSKTAHPAGKLYFLGVLFCYGTLEIGHAACVGEEWAYL